MYLYLTIIIFISTIFSIEPDVVENSSICLTDELYGKFTIEELKHLVSRHKKVRESINKNLSSNYDMKQLDCMASSFMNVIFFRLSSLILF